MGYEGRASSWGNHFFAGFLLFFWALHWNISIFKKYLTSSKQTPYTAQTTFQVWGFNVSWSVEGVLKIALPFIGILYQLLGQGSWRCVTAVNRVELWNRVESCGRTVCVWCVLALCSSLYSMFVFWATTSLSNLPSWCFCGCCSMQLQCLRARHGSRGTLQCQQHSQLGELMDPVLLHGGRYGSPQLAHKDCPLQHNAPLLLPLQAWWMWPANIWTSRPTPSTSSQLLPLALTWVNEH